MKIIMVLFLSVSGCAYPSLTTQYSPTKAPKDQAVVYLYRPNTSMDAVNPDVPRFYIGEEKMGRLKIGGYFVKNVEPGDVKIYYKESLFGIPFPWKTGSLKIHAESGKKYFVRFSVDHLFYRTEFQVVPTGQGESEIAATKLLAY
jgi:hypothetical protein